MMTREQQFWYRRQQVLRAWSNLQQKNAAGSGLSNVRSLKPNLKEIFLDSFTEDYQIVPGEKPTSMSHKGMGACSSVRKGNFHGRNFDFFYDTETSYVVHVGHTEKHNAFIGVAKATFGTTKPSLDKIPNLMKDGINERGVVININVVTKEDLDACGKTNTVTNPGHMLVHQDCVPAYVLAHATSAVDAVQKMQSEISIYGDLGGTEYIHFMISDKKSTFTVEIIGNQLYVIGYETNDPADNLAVGAKVRSEELPIMTNWYLNYDELPTSALVRDDKYTLHACGIERYEILSSGYETADSVFDLMKAARYTNEILLDVTDPRFPFSDACGMSTYGLSAYNEIPLFREFIDGDRAKMRLALETGNRNLGVWITSHNSVYDIESKSFSLVFEEDYDHPMVFKLDQQS